MTHNITTRRHSRTANLCKSGTDPGSGKGDSSAVWVTEVPNGGPEAKPH